MTLHLRTLKEVAPLHVVVVVDGALDAHAWPELLVQLAVLKRRFGLAVSGVAGGLLALGPQGLQSLRARAVFDHLYFSGDPAWIVADGLTAARRTGHVRHLFVSAQSLLNDPIPSLRVLVELLGVSYGALWVPGLSALYCDQSSLETVIRPLAGEAWNSWAARAWTNLRDRAKIAHELGSQWAFKGRTAQSSVDSLGESLELYVSRTGLERFGGWSRMRQQPMRFGGHGMADFGAAFAIDNDAQELSRAPAAEPGLSGVWGWLGSLEVPEGGQGYWVDVVPAPVWADPSEDVATANAVSPHNDTPANVNLPRQMLQMRLTRAPRAPEGPPMRLVFVMSNFEKGPLIPAALYGVAMQTHANVTLHFTDDASTDDSLAYARQFERLLPQSQDFLKIQKNAVNRGTYWIRNEAIYRAHDPETVFLINDSDDVSSLQRGTLQARMLQENPSLSGCFMDIVRIDTEHTPLRLESEVERYGTASLAFRKALVDKVGYFENIKRNADTEFIERVRLLLGSDVLQRYRYPCLYQVFDGRNLTADIYTQVPGGSEIQADHGARALHTLLFRQRHRYLKAESAAGQYRFPESTIPPEYKALGAHFLLPDYGAPDAIAVVMHASDGICRKIAARGALVVQLTTKASPWETGVVRLYDARGVAFSANLGANRIIEHLLQRMRFTGYLLFVHDAAALDGTVRPGALLPQLEKVTLQSKSIADGRPVVVSSDPHAVATFEHGAGFAEVEKWINTKIGTSVLLHTTVLN